MDSILKETYQDIVKKIPKERRDIIIDILLDPDTHTRSLKNLFESGNTKRSKVHGAREELTSMIYYDYSMNSGRKKPQDDERKIRPLGDFTTKVNEHDESITVIMKTDDMEHRFVFPKMTIMNYHMDHPIKGHFAVPSVCGALMKSAGKLRWLKREKQVQMIMNDRQTETITDVYWTPNIVGTKDWQFEVTDDNDSLNSTYATIIRFVAFAYAFDQALKECVKGVIYTDLYRAICFGA